MKEMINEYQKPFTDKGRENYDKIFGPRKVICPSTYTCDVMPAFCDHCKPHKHTIKCEGRCGTTGEGCVPCK